VQWDRDSDVMVNTMQWGVQPRFYSTWNWPGVDANLLTVHIRHKSGQSETG